MGSLCHWLLIGFHQLSGHNLLPSIGGHMCRRQKYARSDESQVDLPGRRVGAGEGGRGGRSGDISMHLEKFLDCEFVIKVTWGR